MNEIADKLDMKASSETTQPADNDGNNPHWLSQPKREEPSRRSDADSKYLLL